MSAAPPAPTLPPTTPAPEAEDVLSEASIKRYQAAAQNIGIKLQALKSQTPGLDPRAAFLRDHAAFLALHQVELKIRRIGGAELDIYGLYRAVLERGGLQAVILSRAFKMVAKTLNLPKSCTSAAFILRVEYEKLLYIYEQAHVWGRSPEQLAPLYPADKARRAAPILRTAALAAALPPSAQLPPPSAPQHPPPVYGAVHPLHPRPISTRPRRQAALAATTAVAAAVSDDPYGFPVFPKRSRLTGLDEASLLPHEEALVDDQIVNDNAPHALYVPGQPGEKERVVSALWSPMHDDVAWALGTLNALSFDLRNLFIAQEFPGILDALYEVLNRHLEDILRKRAYGVAAGMEEIDLRAPRDVQLAAVDVRDAGYVATGPGIGVAQNGLHQGALRSSSLQQYPNLFNLADPIAIDREQCAVVAVNILRNMSFFDRNAMFLATSINMLGISAVMIKTASIPANLRAGLVDMWINVSPYMNASPNNAGSTVLATCVSLLDPHNKEGADPSRFTNSGEVLARLAASPERNEAAIVVTFPELLPRIVDMLGGKHKRIANAALAALCNFSAFDWPARDTIARVPRALDRLVGMLADTEFAPRAALTLLNLAESPNNRSVMIAYEATLVEFAMTPSPAADTVASILFDLSYD